MAWMTWNRRTSQTLPERVNEWRSCQGAALWPARWEKGARPIGRPESSRSIQCRIPFIVVMNIETPGSFGMDSARDRAAVFGGRSRTRPATVGRAILPPLWLEPRLHDQFQKICIQRPKFRQIQDRMDHPLRVAGLLQIGEAKAPGKILRVDHVAYPERQRLSPDHDLVPYK